jgi:cytochrome c biogenesis protein CcdA
MEKNAGQNKKFFQNEVISVLSDHTARLINIEKTLDRLHEVMPVESHRTGILEQKFSFFKGMVYFIMGMLTVFVSLVAIIK